MNVIGLRIQVVLLAIIWTTMLGAQNKKPSDTVYLVDGSILVGEIIEDTDFLIRIVIETGDTLKIGYKNILDGPNSKRKNQQKEPPVFKEEGYFAFLGIRPYFNREGIVEVAGIVGKRMKSNWNLGLSINYHKREDFVQFAYINPGLLNVGLYNRFYLTNKRPKVFIDGDVGYGFSIFYPSFNFGNMESHVDGGLQGAITAGVHFPSRLEINWLIQVGLRYNDTSGGVLSFDQFGGQVFIEYTKQYFTPFMGAAFEF